MPITRHGYATQRRNGSTRQWRKQRAHLLANATHCKACGEPATPDDPFEIDHIIPIASGGTDTPTNLRVVHRTCNRQKGRVF